MMKRFLYAICAVMALMLVSCSDSNGDLGLSVRPDDEGIVLGTDTFKVNSFSVQTGVAGSPIVSTADSLLLGEYYDATYGTTRGEILAQFTAPTTFAFPAGSTTKADSLSLTLVFNTWKGNKRSPVQISAYEMDKGTLSYNTVYTSDEKASKYCSFNDSTLLGSRISVAVPDTITDTATYQPHLVYKFSSKQVQRFAKAIKNKTFSTQSGFSNFFKGIHLRSEYGDGAIWNIHTLYMTFYYSYHAFVNNKDTVLTSGVIFPASKDVRQINMIAHKDINKVLTSIPDSVTYITAPAGIYTQINLPVGRILNKAKARFGNKVINFNHANMKVEATNIDTISGYALKPPATLLLARKADLLTFIKNYSFATDTIIAASYNSSTKSYTFDLSKKLTYLLHKKFKGQTIPDNYVEEMVLVPIEYGTASSTSSTITSLRQQPTLSAVQLRSGKNPKYPLKINIFYNGF